jgi:glycosyltransferase involved in cell wall biosynthesis
MDGFEYFFCAGVTRPNGWFAKKYTGVIGIYNSVKMINKLHRKEPIDAILTFSQSLFQNFPLYLIARFNKIVFIRENNEFPIRVIQRGHSKLMWHERLFFKFVNRFYDGFILISSTLATFNKQLFRKSMPIKIVPIIVDKERFKFSDVKRNNLITYCGNLFGEKDGVKILIEAFSKLHLRHTDYKLVLIGDTSRKKEFKVLQQFIKDFGIESKVEFKGFVHRDHIPNLLIQSSVLVLARPDNIQTKGGFPTKLGEYLASGRPVLVTSVSDIPKYIQDGVNGYLAKAGSVDDFTKKLDWILSNFDEAEKVGHKGQKLTEKEFNHVYQAGRVISFMGKIKSKQLYQV